MQSQANLLNSRTHQLLLHFMARNTNSSMIQTSLISEPLPLPLGMS